MLTFPHTVVCLQRHRDGSPRVVLPATGETGRDGSTLARLAMGQCPACPGQTLQPAMLALGGGTVHARRCPCCQASWRYGIDWWQCLAQGRLSRS